MSSYWKTLATKGKELGLISVYMVLFILSIPLQLLYIVWYPTRTYMYSKLLSDARVINDAIHSRHGVSGLNKNFYYTIDWSLDSDEDYDICIQIHPKEHTKQHNSIDYLYQFEVEYSLISGYTVTNIRDRIIWYMDSPVPRIVDSLGRGQFIAHNQENYFVVQSSQNRTDLDADVYYGSLSTDTADYTLESIQYETLHEFISSMNWFMDTARYTYQDYYADDLRKETLQYIVIPDNQYREPLYAYYVFETYTLVVDTVAKENFVFPALPDEFEKPLTSHRGNKKKPF